MTPAAILMTISKPFMTISNLSVTVVMDLKTFMTVLVTVQTLYINITYIIGKYNV